MNEKYDPQQAIEQFHLLFLSQLSQKLDQKLYALKGGCNLRFYFNSIRYSEDMDLDVQIVNKDTLTKKINNILQSKPFKQILWARQIKITKISEAKQTETTQRWKLLLDVPGSNIPLNTKIEFSRRENKIRAKTKFEPIAAKLIQQYQLTPIFVNHYTAMAAYQQKIAALAHRKEVQARDVFDIYLLLQYGASSVLIDDNKIKKKLIQAKNNAMAISFAEYKSQVVAYLEMDYQQQYETEEMWDHILLSVVAALDLGKNDEVN
jgi:predicted nucleotidyltransferase component of viral defense system